ncbi:sulfotransferase family protein [Sphingomonas arenae]|uniref:sulfotransferase family protein n=1 Tax=Sphingomonas arenae TaxID=2812555 RepID=UPI001966D6A6|nr:sulfotransferase [Sphingomonas arenae]
MSKHLPIVAAINKALHAAWRTGRWQPPTLNPDAIEAYASRKEGVTRVPGRHWREAYSVLLDDLERQSQLSPLGRVIANGQMVKLLRGRIRAERLLLRKPEILEQPLGEPVIIVGQMRSGTTRLHRLLSCDPNFAHTRLFESLEPIPYSRGHDRRLPLGAAVTAFLRLANPATQRVHPTGPLRPEEEFGFNSFSFHGAQFEVQWSVPGFAHLCEERDTGSAYAEFRTLVQITRWARREKAERPWLLKCPQFTADLESLLQVFPNARFLFLHRRYADVVGSSASLVREQRCIHSEHVDPHAIGREWLRKTRFRAERVARFRGANPQVPRLDVDFDEVSRDWLSQIRRIYAFLEIPLAPETMNRMQRYAGRATAHRGHSYALEEFGLSPRLVEETLAQSSISRVAELA